VTLSSSSSSSSSVQGPSCISVGRQPKHMAVRFFFFFDELVPAITIMGPLASLFAAIESVDDFGYFYFEPYGVLPSYQHSGLSLTMINVPAWRRVEEILSSQANVTASMTPCKEGKTHTYTPTTPFESSPSSPPSSSSSCLDVGNYIEDAQSPARKGYQGVFISFMSDFLLPCSFCLCFSMIHFASACRERI